MKQIVPLALLIVAAMTGSAGSPGSTTTGKGGPGRLMTPTTSGDYTIFDVNNVRTYIRNNGSFDRDPATGNAGYEWPEGTGNTAIYASGLWLGGKSNADGLVRVAVAEYSYEYDAGPMLPGGGWADPSDQRYRIYKVRRGDTYGSNPDFANWPGDDGAPYVDVDSDGMFDPPQPNGGGDRPLVLGDMTVWCVFNEADPSVHMNMNTPPLGIEVQLTAYAYDLPNALGNSIFYAWKLINKGGRHFDSAFVSVWSDPDLGDSGDDYDGCDTTLNLGYTYNADTLDGVYGIPPAVGFDLLQGPLVPGAPTDTARFPDGRMFPGMKFLGMTSFIKYTNDQTDLGNPSTGQEVLSYQKGLTRSGQTILNGASGLPTTLMFPGDPRVPYGPTNWIENGLPGDRRFLMSAGPFTMAPGDTQEIVAASVIAQSVSNTASVGALKEADSLVQLAYELGGAMPIVDVGVAWPSGTTAMVSVIADARSVPSDSVSVALKRRDGTMVAEFRLFDDGLHGDSSGTDGIWANSVSVTREPHNMSLDLRYKDPLNRYVSLDSFVDFITTVGPVLIEAPVVFSDNINGDGQVNPGENIRYGFTVVNGTPFTLTDIIVSTDPNFSGTASLQWIPVLDSGGTFTRVYNPSDPSTYFDFAVPGVYSDSTFDIQVRIGDAVNNRWRETIRFPVREPEHAPYGTPVTHSAGQSEWALRVSVVNIAAIQNHLYEVSVVDSANGGSGGLTLRDLTSGDTLFEQHEYPDVLGHNAPVTAGFKVVRGLYWGDHGLRNDSTRWISFFPPWLTGYRFWGPPSAFNGGATPAYDLPGYLSHIASTLDQREILPVEIRFNSAVRQKAYRLRRAGGLPLAYVIQASNPFVDVPFTAWDVSNPAQPRQLTLAWNDQDDGGSWNPQEYYDGNEIIFVYLRTYNPLGHQWPYQDEGADSSAWSDACTVGSQADMLYGLSLALEYGHTMNESPGVLYLRPWHVAMSADRYTFNPTLVHDGEPEQLPWEFVLGQNYPNPFNPSTTIRYTLPGASLVVLDIYNILGQKVRGLVSEEQTAGEHVVHWDATNETGRPVATGVYFCRLEARTADRREYIKVMKMLLLR